VNWDEDRLCKDSASDEFAGRTRPTIGQTKTYSRRRKCRP